MNSIIKISLVIFTLPFKLFAQQTETGQITTTPSYVTLSDKTQPFQTPVGPQSDGTYKVTFNAICNDTTLNVTGVFANANQTGTVTFTPTSGGAMALITYPASAAGNANSASVTVTSANGGPCTTSNEGRSPDLYHFVSCRWGSSNDGGIAILGYDHKCFTLPFVETSFQNFARQVRVVKTVYKFSVITLKRQQHAK